MNTLDLIVLITILTVSVLTITFIYIINVEKKCMRLQEDNAHLEIVLSSIRARKIMLDEENQELRNGMNSYKSAHEKMQAEVEDLESDKEHLNKLLSSKEDRNRQSAVELQRAEDLKEFTLAVIQLNRIEYKKLLDFVQSIKLSKANQNLFAEITQNIELSEYDGSLEEYKNFSTHQILKSINFDRLLKFVNENKL